MASKILVAVGLTKIAKDLVRVGLKLSRRLGSSADFMYVLPPIDSWLGYKAWLPQEAMGEVEEESRQRVAQLVASVDPKASPAIHIAQGNVSEKIIERIKAGGYGLLIVGYKGDNPLVEIVVGSTASSLTRYAPCSVLIYRPGMDFF